ncbi:MAG: AAA family ATPase [Aliidongia sp.]
MVPSLPKSAKDIKLDQYNLYLFVGPADGGKSFAATSFGYMSADQIPPPGMVQGTDPRPMYVMELDGRLAALRGRPVVYDAFTNVEGAAGVLNRLVSIRDICVQRNKAPFHTILIDSFTSFNDFAISDSLEVSDNNNAGRKRGDLSLMTVQDYGYEAEAVRKLLWENLVDLKRYCNVIVTAHEMEYYKPVKVKEGEPTRSELAGYKILARDKISAKLPTKFDEIYHFLPKEVIISQKKIRRRIVFQDQLARTSFPELAKSTEEYDISGQEFYYFWAKKIGRI